MSEEPNPALYAPVAERSVLGAVLLDEQHLTALIVDEQLGPEHFADRNLATVFQAVVELQDAGRPVDYLTLTDYLRDHGRLERIGGERLVEELTSWVPATGNAREYGRIVRQRHQARELLGAARKIQADVLARSAPIDELLSSAGERLDAISRDGHYGLEKSTWSAQELRDKAFDAFQNGKVVAYPYEFAQVNKWVSGGGARPGQFILIGGWGSVGKSALLDAWLQYWATQDLRVHLYINETSEAERIDRTLSRISGIPHDRVSSKLLLDGEDRKVLQAIGEIGYGITDCAGWTAEEIARHIKRNRWDVSGLDGIHDIDYSEERDLSHISQVLRTCALQARTALLCTVHLNDARATSNRYPVPVARDIRGSGMLWRRADVVFFIHRDYDEDGLPTDAGVLVAAKVRNGKPSLMRVTFDGELTRFLPALPGSAEKGFDAPVSADTWTEPATAGMPF